MKTMSVSLCVSRITAAGETVCIMEVDSVPDFGENRPALVIVVNPSEFSNMCNDFKLENRVSGFVWLEQSELIAIIHEKKMQLLNAKLL